MQIHPISRASARLAILLASALSAHSALAQIVPSQSQTPPGEEVERRSSDADINFTIGGVLAAPPDAETVELTIGSIDLEGGFDPVAADTAALLPKPDSKATLAEIYAAAAAIQQAYFDAGFPLVRVFVPVQDLDPQNAQILLKIVSGFVGEVQTDTLHPKIRSVVARMLAPLVGKDRLTAEELERAVLLAGDLSGVQLSSALSPGTQLGETVLIVNGRYRPVQAVLSFDNRLSPQLGREQVTLSTAFNSILGLGERIGVTVATALDDPSLSGGALRRFGGLNLDLPIGNDGFVVGANAALSTARPEGSAELLALASRFERLGGRMSYPLIRTRSSRLIATTSLDLNEETQNSLLLGSPVSLFRDQTTVARIGLNGDIQNRSGFFLAASIDYSRGLDLFDARRADDATILEPLSRIGADAVFDKLTGSMLIEANLPKTPVSGRVLVRGQTGFGDPLLRSEQFSFAAPDLISGPPTGSLVGDTAIAARSQIEINANSKGARFVPYAFGAIAHARLENPTAFELATTDTYAIGTGINMQIPLGDLALTGSLEFSHTDSDDFNANGEWVTFQLAFRF